MVEDDIVHWLGAVAERVAWRHNTSTAFIEHYDKLMSEARARGIAAGQQARARHRPVNAPAG